MKNHFIGFVEISEEDSDKCWNEGLVFLDTNVLLSLYQYKAETVDSLLSIFDTFGNRVWINHFVGLEFFRNRPHKIKKQSLQLSRTRTLIEKISSDLEKELANGDLEGFHTTIGLNDFLDRFNELKLNYVQKLEEKKETLDYKKQDHVLLNRIDLIIGNNVTKEPSKEEIEEQDAEAKLRFENRIPPGYEDRGKDRESNPTFMYNGVMYQRKNGDYYNWMQIIAQAKEADLPVIFITDDSKEDWWWFHESSKDKISPRPELMQEFYKETNHNIIICNTKNFVRLSDNRSGNTVSPDVLDDIAQVSFLEAFRRNSKTLQESESREMIVLDGVTEIYSMVETWLRNSFPLVIETPKSEYSDLLATSFTDKKAIGISIHIPLPQKLLTLHVIKAVKDVNWKKEYGSIIHIFPTYKPETFEKISGTLRGLDEEDFKNQKISVYIILLANSKMSKTGGILDIEAFGYSDHTDTTDLN